MLQPFASELSSVFNSARCSASIRPLTVKITSPFVALVILSIFAALSCCFFLRRCLSHALLWQSQFQPQAVHNKCLSCCGMSGSSSIAEIRYSRFQKRLCCGRAEMRLADFGG